MTVNDREATLTRFIANQFRRHRKERGWSAQQLSDECPDHGMPISRDIISGLENGRQQSISIAQFLTIASALGISPADLFSGTDPAAWTYTVPPPIGAIRRKVAELSRLLEYDPANPQNTTSTAL